MQRISPGVFTRENISTPSCVGGTDGFSISEGKARALPARRLLAWPAPATRPLRCALRPALRRALRRALRCACACALNSSKRSLQPRSAGGFPAGIGLQADPPVLSPGASAEAAGRGQADRHRGGSAGQGARSRTAPAPLPRRSRASPAPLPHRSRTDSVPLPHRSRTALAPLQHRSAPLPPSPAASLRVFPASPDVSPAFPCILLYFSPHFPASHVRPVIALVLGLIHRTPPLVRTTRRPSSTIASRTSWEPYERAGERTRRRMASPATRGPSYLRTQRSSAMRIGRWEPRRGSLGKGGPEAAAAGLGCCGFMGSLSLGHHTSSHNRASSYLVPDFFSSSVCKKEEHNSGTLLLLLLLPLLQLRLLLP